jgi:hypothetical protein
MKNLAVLAFLACSAAPMVVHGHHSFAIFDADSPQTVTGVVREFRWTNPHTWVFLTVTNEDGSEIVWELEHGPTNMLSRGGWSSSTLTPGDRIAVEVHPAHNGRAVARFIEFEFVEDEQEERLSSLTGGSTIRNVSPPEPVEMSQEVARNFNGIWLNANGGIHFDTAAPSRSEQTPPLREEYMRAWRQRLADARAGRSTNDPTAQCLPPGFPRFLSMVYPGEILQTEHQLNWFGEWGEGTVRVYLDGREVPETLERSYYGFTTGRWSGNTLVTRTVGLRGDTLVDTTGIPHSDQLTVTMRMTKLTPDYFEARVTLEDPVVFHEPWTTVKRYVRAPADYYIQEFSCFEGNRYRVNEDGSVEVVTEDSAQP